MRLNYEAKVSEDNLYRHIFHRRFSPIYVFPVDGFSNNKMKTRDRPPYKSILEKGPCGWVVQENEEIKSGKHAANQLGVKRGSDKTRIENGT